ncbi:MAG: CHAP domain-containing protein [Bdellovibrionales bacterium]|nr:CHAP domain-containing protein [Bdellovibrionales bacterium]
MIFGDVLGKDSSGVTCYCNGVPEYVGQEEHFLDDLSMGLKWQCVEYTRRWTYLNKKILLPDIEKASDLWSLGKTEDGLKWWSVVANGQGPAPLPGDVLVWDCAFRGTGHVAIALGRIQGAGPLPIGNAYEGLAIAEQNYSSNPWPGEYSRSLPFQQTSSGVYIESESLLGWLQWRKPGREVTK